MATTKVVTKRVYRLAPSLKERFRSARTLAAQTNAAFVEAAVKELLPQLIDELTALGLESASETKPILLRLDPEVLVALRAGSDATGLAQQDLLRLVLARRAEAILGANAAKSQAKQRSSAKKVSPKKPTRPKSK